VLHSHDCELRQIPSGDKVFFTVRDPIDRFVSGFNSRKRRGQPLFDNPWSVEEQRAYWAFPTANSLASALSSDEREQRASARAAMISIGHVRSSYWRWFHDRKYLQSRLDDLLLIMWFPSLDASFACLLELLGLSERAALPNNDVVSHRSPASADRRLGDCAIENLKHWYGADTAFLEVCATLECFAPRLEAQVSGETAPFGSVRTSV
jgi:hypothetical protein